MARVKGISFVYLLLIACALFTNCLAEEPTEPTESNEPGPEPTEEGHENKEELAFQTYTAMLIILTVLVFLSILFELARDKVEEGTDKIMRPIVGSLWKELTVLGFLSLISFLVVRVKLIETISEAVFGEKEGEKLVEIMENVHMGLFFVMMIFLVSVLILVRFGTKSERKWRHAEKLAKNPEEAYGVYNKLSQERQRNGVNYFNQLFGLGKEGQYQQAVFHMEYIAIRDAFINPSDPLAAKLHPDFDFSDYLAYNLAHTLSNIIEIHPFTWMFLEVIFVIVWAAQLIPESWAGLLVELSLIYGMLVVAVFVRIKMNRIKSQLIVPFDLENSTFSTRSPVPARNVPMGNVQDEVYPNDSVGEVAVLLPTEKTQVAGRRQAPYQLQEMQPRGTFGKIFMGAPGNKHENLFWFDKKGPKFLLQCVRSMLLFVAFFLAFYSATVAAAIIESGFEWYYVVELVVAFVPVPVLSYFLVPQIIRRHVFCCNIEMLKKKKTITKVIGLQKTKKTVRALKMVHSLRIHVGAARERKHKEKNKSKKESLDKHQINEYQKIFDLFDADKSGAISPDEFRAFMNALGQHITIAEAHEMIGEMEMNSDGELGFDEFCQFMSGQAGAHEIEPEKLAKKMFEIFDKDKSGTITTEEFLHVMEKMGESLTREDVEDIVLELDKDGDGEIDAEEFEAFVKKHT